MRIDSPDTKKQARALRVGVLGGGITGAATAGCLVALSRARKQPVDIRLYDAPREETCAPPAIVSAQCRKRLLGLGAQIPPSWRANTLRALELVTLRERRVIDLAGSDLWVVDDWGGDGAGARLIAQSLTAAAALHGATVLPRAVSQVHPVTPGVPGIGKVRGHVLLRSRGQSEAVDVAILAGRAHAELEDRFFPGFRPAPTLSGARARLRLTRMWPLEQSMAKLLWRPTAGLDALWLIPAARSIFVLGYGAQATPADVCEGLMVAARERLLPEGLDIQALVATEVPCGVGQGLEADFRLATGPAVFGHPFDLTVSSRLLCASRAALAVLESRGEEPELAERFLLNGVDGMVRESEDGARAHRWLRRAGIGAPSAVARAIQRAERAPPVLRETDVLGTQGLPTERLLPSARWEGIKRSVWDAVRRPEAGFRSAQGRAPFPAHLEPGLFYVVEDEPAVREAITGLLENHGARVVAFSNELALYAAAARRRPEAILLDVVLPWVDGLQLCEGLKSHPLTRDIRVIVTSGLDLPHLRARALAAGADIFLPKPVEPWHLWAALGGWHAEDERRPLPEGDAPRAVG